MKSIQHPENHPVFMAIPPQPHHKTLSLTVIIFFSLLFALQASISLGSQLFPALKFSR